MKEKETKIEMKARYKKIKYWYFFWIAIAFISIWWLHLTIPIIIIWYVWKKTKLDKKKKWIATGLAFFLLITMSSIKYYTGRTPTITITEPENNFSIQADNIIIRGIVTPKKSKLTINSNPVPIENGFFVYNAELTKEDNNFVFIATNNKNKNETFIIINRIFTDEEIAEIEAKKQAAIEARKKIEEEKKAEELAKQRAWEQSKAGQICKVHPEWTKLECERIADNKIWIGMTIDMLKYERGLPNSANPSNYGFGITWQWCWWKYTPSCFYGDDDGIIDSYN